MLNERILIVDDNVGFCNTLQKILTKFGYDSDVAHSRGDALSFLKKDISLYLLDIGLPGSDEEGLDLLKEIKAYKPMASVIMITGNQNYEFLVNCISAGAADFFYQVKAGCRLYENQLGTRVRKEKKLAFGYEKH